MFFLILPIFMNEFGEETSGFLLEKISVSAA